MLKASFLKMYLVLIIWKWESLIDILLKRERTVIPPLHHTTSQSPLFSITNGAIHKHKIPITSVHHLRLRVINKYTSYSEINRLKRPPQIGCPECCFFSISPSLKANFVIVPRIRPRPLPFTPFQFHYSVITLSFGAAHSELQKGLLNMSPT
jgi:hypothetical protein